MILIKDRHLMTSAPQIGHLKGNYDTYKGSTLYFQLVLLHQNDWEL